MPPPLERVTLSGRSVQLEPLAHQHVDDLVEAASVDRSTFAHTWVPDGHEAMSGYVDQLLADHAAGRVLAFAQRRTDTGRAVGCTRFMEVRWWRGRAEPDEVEIGGTWLGADAQRTAINTEAKLLLMTHAFETLGVWRLAICTDAANERSRTAIERLGATFEGILRNHRMRYNTDPIEPRDSALYSVTDHEWPAVRRGLEARLAA